METRVCISVLALLVAFPAFAAEEEGALVEKVAVRNKLFTTAGRFELGINLGFTALTQMTEHYTANLNVGYNIVETFGVELLAGGSYSRQTSLARDVAEQFHRTTSRSADDLSNLWEMVANGTIGFRWQPLYGKIGGLLQDVLLGNPIHFQFYVSLGGGVGYFKRASVVICNDTSVRTLGAGECRSYYQENSVGPLVTAALGWRLFLPIIGNHHSLRVEVRDFSYLDTYYVNVDRPTAWNEANPTGNGTPSSLGITNLVQVHVGYSYMF